MQRPKLWILAAAVALAAAALGGCASKQEDAKPAPAPLARVVGRVASVDPAGHYVLIQVLGTWTVPDEVLLQVRSSATGGATLRPSGERQGRYLAADIVSGNPATGDAVIYLPATPASPAPATTVPSNLATSTPPTAAAPAAALPPRETIGNP